MNDNHKKEIDPLGISIAVTAFVGTLIWFWRDTSLESLLAWIASFAVFGFVYWGSESQDKALMILAVAVPFCFVVGLGIVIWQDQNETSPSVIAAATPSAPTLAPELSAVPTLAPMSSPETSDPDVASPPPPDAPQSLFVRLPSLLHRARIGLTEFASSMTGKALNSTGFGRILLLIGTLGIGLTLSTGLWNNSLADADIVEGLSYLIAASVIGGAALGGWIGWEVGQWWRVFPGLVLGGIIGSILILLLLLLLSIPIIIDFIYFKSWFGHIWNAVLSGTFLGITIAALYALLARTAATVFFTDGILIGGAIGLIVRVWLRISWGEWHRKRKYRSRRSRRRSRRRK